MRRQEEEEDAQYEYENAQDPRPKIYMAIFSTILFLGLLEVYLIRLRKQKAA